MGKKAFEEERYDPIGADLARDVAAAGRITAPAGIAGVPPLGRSSPPIHHVPPSLLPTGRAASGVDSAAREATITKRFVLTRTEDDELNEFLLRLQKQVGTKVTLSVIVRAALTVVMQAENQVSEEIRGWPMRFPSTHDPLAQNSFEAEWIRCIGRAIRRAPSPTAFPTRGFAG